MDVQSNPGKTQPLPILAGQGDDDAVGTIRPISPTLDGNARNADLRTALRLTYITLGWMTIEGAASLILGWSSKSLLLEAFGIDSVIELLSAGVLLWRLRVEASGQADEPRIESVERRAAILMGYMLYALARIRRAELGLRTVRNSPGYRHGRKCMGNSHWAGCQNRDADSRRVQTESCRQVEFACLAGRCDGVDHLRLPVHCANGRPGGDAAGRLVVARQRGRTRLDSVPLEGREISSQRRCLLLCRRCVQELSPRTQGHQPPVTCRGFLGVWGRIADPVSPSIAWMS